MSDDFQDDDLHDDDTDETGLVKNLRGQLSEKAQAAKEALARAEAAERQLAFRDAGLDMGNSQHKFFADNYQGDLNAEAVKAKATELGFLEPPKPAVSDETVADHAAINAAVDGAQTAAPDTGVGSAQYEQEMAEASTKGRDAVLEVMERYGSPFVKEIV